MRGKGKEKENKIKKTKQWKNEEGNSIRKGTAGKNKCIDGMLLFYALVMLPRVKVGGKERMGSLYSQGCGEGQSHSPHFSVKRG